jgi:hypothetical protein
MPVPAPPPFSAKVEVSDFSVIAIGLAAITAGYLYLKSRKAA